MYNYCLTGYVNGYILKAGKGRSILSIKKGFKKMKNCKERVKEAYQDRITDIRKLYKAGAEEVEDLGTLAEYGLSIDKVGAGTFEKQREDYLRYQLSYGGPSEEFRIYKNGEVEFWLLDWFDGAKVEVKGNDAEMIKDIVEIAGLSF